MANATARSWWGWVYLVVVGSLFAYTAFVWLVGHAPLSLVSTYAYVNPVVAVLLGWWILGEPLTVGLLVGGARRGRRRDARRQRGANGAATLRKRSLASVSPMVTRTPSSP